MVTAAKQAVVAVTAVRTQLTGIQLRLLVNLDAITIIKLAELAIAIIAVTAVTARYAIAIVIVIPVASSVVVVVVLTALLVTHQQMAASSNQRTIGDYFRFHLETTTTTAQPSKLIDVNTVIVVEVAVIAVIVTAIVDAAIEGIKREQQQSGYCGCCWLDLRSLRMAIAVSLIIAIIITAVRAIVVAAAAAAERVAIEVITKKAAIKDCSAVAREAEIIASIDLLRITAITAIVMIIAIDTGVEAVARATAIITVVTTITTTAAAATAEEEHWNYVMITMLIAVI